MLKEQPFGETLTFPRRACLECQYFSNASTNHENFLSIALFDEGFAITLQELCLNLKVIADF